MRLDVHLGRVLNQQQVPPRPVYLTGRGRVGQGSGARPAERLDQVGKANPPVGEQALEGHLFGPRRGQPGDGHRPHAGEGPGQLAGPPAQAAVGKNLLIKRPLIKNLLAETFFAGNHDPVPHGAIEKTENQ